jgi:hypothetical protein
MWALIHHPSSYCPFLLRARLERVEERKERTERTGNTSDQTCWLRPLVIIHDGAFDQASTFTALNGAFEAVVKVLASEMANSHGSELSSMEATQPTSSSVALLVSPCP